MYVFGSPHADVELADSDGGGCTYADDGLGAYGISTKQISKYAPDERIEGNFCVR